MPRTCTICTHPERPAIDHALLNGGAFRHIAAQTGTSTTALQRHKADHLPALMARSKEAEEIGHADDLVREVGSLRARAMSLLLMAETAGDVLAANGSIREARACLELQAKLLGELHEGTTINLAVSPAWVEVRAVLMAALAPHPQARAAVAERLARLEAGDDRAA